MKTRKRPATETWPDLVQAASAYVLPDRQPGEWTAREFAQAHTRAGRPMSEHSAASTIKRMIADGAAVYVGRCRVPGVRSGAMCYRLTGK